MAGGNAGHSKYMKTGNITCDIDCPRHNGVIKTIKIAVIFDHDQEDGRTRCEPYLDSVEIEICQDCKERMLRKRQYIYAYGAMGNNSYYV